MAVVEGAGFREPKLAKAATRVSRGRADAMVSWAHILKALAASEVAGDSELAQRLSKFVRGTSVYKDAVRRQPDREPSIAQKPGTTWVHEASKRNPDQGIER